MEHVEVDLTDPVKTIGSIINAFGNGQKLAVAVIVMTYVALLGLARLFDIWRGFRARRAILEEEKLFNEILKIRYEIEVLRKQHDLPDLAAADGLLAPASRQGAGEHGGAGRAHPRFGFSLPEIPSLSFAPVLSLFGVSLKRPGAGIPRSLWSLKLLLALAVGTLLLLILALVILPVAFQEKAGVTVLIVAALVALYLLSTLLYNLVLAAVRMFAAPGSSPRPFRS